MGIVCEFEMYIFKFYANPFNRWRKTFTAFVENIGHKDRINIKHVDEILYYYLLYPIFLLSNNDNDGK